MADPEAQKAYDAHYTAERVSPAIAYLAHEACDVTGALFDAGGGNVSARLFCSTPGIDKLDLTIEDIRDNLDVIFDKAALEVVMDPRIPLQAGNDAVAAMLIPTPYEPT
jgi:hypothetical protein